MLSHFAAAFERWHEARDMPLMQIPLLWVCARLGNFALHGEYRLI